MFVKPVFAQTLDWSSCLLKIGGVEVPTLSCVWVVIARIIKFSAALVIFILFAMFIVGSFYYLTAFGNEEKVKKAQNTIKYAVLGLVIFASSYLILRIIGYVFLDDPNALLIIDFFP